jgi:hypothetical protein
MNLRPTLVVLVVLISVGAFADRPDLNKYSDAELWDSADLIALVRIESGTYVKDVGFDVVAELLKVLKGDSDRSLTISAHHPLLNAPNQLGSSYLVFLTESGPGHYDLINEVRSAVPTIYVEMHDDVAIRMNVLRKSDDRDWYSLDGSLWIVDCGVVRIYPMGEHCKPERSVVEYAMNRLGGVKGRRGVLICTQKWSEPLYLDRSRGLNVDLHVRLTHLLQPGNAPHQPSRIAVYSRI